MHDSNDGGLIAAARSAALARLRSNSTGTREEDLAVLDRSVEERSFVKGALVPIRAVVERCLRALGDQLSSANDDCRVHEIWMAEVDLAVLDFSVQPESWDDHASRQFVATCGLAFGVHDALVPSLLRHFHRRGQSARFAILVKLLRSKSFAFLLREIESMPER